MVEVIQTCRVSRTCCSILRVSSAHLSLTLWSWIRILKAASSSSSQTQFLIVSSSIAMVSIAIMLFQSVDKKLSILKIQKALTISKFKVMTEQTKLDLLLSETLATNSIRVTAKHLLPQPCCPISPTSNQTSSIVKTIEDSQRSASSSPMTKKVQLNNWLSILNRLWPTNQAEARSSSRKALWWLKVGVGRRTI